MKKKLTIKDILEPKKREVKLDDFKLLRGDSHIVTEPVPGYTHTIDGTHFLLTRALVDFPSLRIDCCSGCRRLVESINRGTYVATRKSSTLEHY